MPKTQTTKRAFDGDGRRRLLLVAMHLISQSGFDGVTVREIAAGADVSAGLIKHHFGSKEGLRDAVDAYFLERSRAALDNAIVASTKGVDFNLEQYEQGWIQRYANEWPDFVAYLRRAILEDSPWGKSLFQRYYQSIRSAIDRWDIEGRIATDVDRVWMPLLYMFLLMGPIVLDGHIVDILGKSTFSPDMWGRFQKALTSFLWSGVGVKNS